MPTILPAAIYLIGGSILPFLKGNTRKYFMWIVALLGLLNVLSLTEQTSCTYNFLGIEMIFLKVDKLSLIVGYIFAFIGLLGAIYSSGAKEKGLHTSAFWYVGSSMGAVYAGDFLSLYIFWEIMAVASTVVVWSRQDSTATRIGFKYLMMHMTGGLFLLGGIVLQYSYTGSIAITAAQSGLPLALFFIGIGVNAGFLPFHTWLPDAYPTAPLTGSVFMSVYTTKTAVYMLARVVPGIEMVAIMGACMAVYGASFALMQNNPRKLLSYHIISQVGYMVAAIGIGGAMGINGGIFHLVNHIFYKALLFMCVGSVIYSTGKEKLTELGGLVKKMPITTACVTVAALSISGMAAFNGFASKAMIFEAAHGNDFVYLMLELAAVGTFLSFLKLTWFGFYRPNDSIEASDPPLFMTIPMIVVAIFCVWIGVQPDFFASYLPYAVPAGFHFYTLGHIGGVILLLGVTAGLFFGFRKYYAPHDRVIMDFDYYYEKVIIAFKDICLNIGNGLSAISDLVIGTLMVRIWLPLSDSSSVIKSIHDSFKIDPKPSEIPWQFKAKDSFHDLCEFTNEVDTEILDGVVNDLGNGSDKLGNFFSEGIERYVIYGIVNSFAYIILLKAKFLRYVQTGYVHNYLFVLMLGIFIILVTGIF